MAINNTRYIYELIRKSINESKYKNDKILIIKNNYSQYDIKYEIEKMINENTKYLYHEYNDDIIQKPYEPLLDWIKELYYEYFSEININDFLEECEVYPLHIPIIKSYIENGVCRRDERIILSEVSYERDQFIESIIRVLHRVSRRKKMVIVLNKIHKSSIAILRVIRKLKDSKLDFTNIVTIITYNEVEEVASYMNDEFFTFIKEINNFGTVVDWGSKEQEKNCDIEETIKLEDIDLYDAITRISGLIQTFANNQAIYYLQGIKDVMNKSTFELEMNEYVKIEVLRAVAYLMNDEPERALLVLTPCISLCKKGIDELIDDDVSMSVYYYAVYSLIQTEKYDEANEHIEFMKSIFIDNEEYEFMIELLEYIVKFRGWNNIFLSDFSFYIPKELLDKIEKKNYLNHLAHIYIYGYNNVSNNNNNKSIYERNNEVDYFETGIEIAEQIKNNKLILDAYYKNMTIATCFNQCKLVDYYYEECKKAVTDLTNEQKALLYNSVGYNFILQEMYIQANEYFNNALELFYEEENIESILETLYNKGVNAFTAERYDKAREVLSVVVDIMNDMNIASIKVCNIAKIYGLLALSNFYLGAEYNCYIYHDKMKYCLSHLLDKNDNKSFAFWDDELFLYRIINAIMYRKDGDYELADIELNKAEHHMMQSIGSKFYSYPIYVAERVKLYKKQCREEKADRVFEKCIEFCTSRGYFYKLNLLMNELGDDNSKKREDKYEMTAGNISIDDIKQLYQRKSMKNKLNKAQNNLMYLNKIQEMFKGLTVSSEELIRDVVCLIKNQTKLDNILLVNTSDMIDVRILFNDNEELVDTEVIYSIIEYIDNNTRTFSACKNEKSSEKYSGMFDILGRNKVFDIVCVPILLNTSLIGIMIGYNKNKNNYLYNKLKFDKDDLSFVEYIINELMILLKARNYLNI